LDDLYAGRHVNEYALFAIVQITLLVVLGLAVSLPAINDYRRARQRRRVLLLASRHHRR